MTEHAIYRPKKLTPQEIREGCVTLVGDNNIETKVCIAQEELRQGMDTIEEYQKSVTCYGSARLAPGTEYYEHARSIAGRIVRETGYAIITGGGPGIMEAANRGAFEAGGDSIGLTIVLPHEQHTNPYVTLEIPFYYFFTRKTTLSFSSKILIGFPGGLGTFDEIFEVLTLMQTKKIPKRPVILFGSSFWGPVDAVIKNTLLDEFHTISPEDLDLYTITDDPDHVLEIIKGYISEDTL
jgi:uncharacterized protein (TIGR00730 family)